jgi:hypothetical protein
LARALTLYCCAALASASWAADSSFLIPPFAAAPGSIAAPWEPLRLPKHIARALATVSIEQGLPVLQVTAEKQAGGAFLRLPKPSPHVRLTWQWRVDRVLTTADLTRKDADDFAARVYVMFDYPTERLAYFDRLKARLARTIYDSELPLATLCYVWDNRQPRDAVFRSVYTDRVRLIVLRNAQDHTGRWVEETRDLAADFRRAFGDDPPPLIGIAFAADTDNTGEHATTAFKQPKLHSQ